MAITKISKNQVLVEMNQDDVGLFDGLNVLSYNADNVPEKVEEGVYLNDIISVDEKEVVKNQNVFFNNIPHEKVVIGANFQPLETTAKLKFQDRDFLLITTNENASSNNYVNVLKLFELKDNILIDCQVEKIRTKLQDMKDTFYDIFQAVIKESKNKEVKTNTLIESVSKDNENLYKKNENGKISINLDMNNYKTHINNFTQVVEENKNIINFGDEIINKLARMHKYKVENDVILNANSIINNDGKNQFNIEYTKIDRYNITMTEPVKENANSVKLDYSIRPKNISENYYDKFRTSYVSEEIRKDLPEFIKKAKEDPFVAYHLAKQLKKELKNDLFTINTLIKGARENTLSTEDRIKFNNANENAMKIIKKIVDTNLTSINFNANYYAKNFVSEKNKPENRQISAFFDLLLKTAKSKINNINNLENIIPVADGTRIRNNASISPIFYNGSVPKGNSIIEFEKKSSLKGTMGKELVADIKIIPSQIIFPEKVFMENDKEQKINARIIAPSENSMLLNKQIFNTLSLISKMNKVGEITNKVGDSFLVNVEARIDKIKDLAFGEKGQLEWKSNTKTKEVYENIIKELDARKGNPSELVDFVNSIFDKTIKNKVLNKNSGVIATAIKHNFYDLNKDWQNSVARINAKIINKKLENGQYLNDQDGLNQSVKKVCNQIIGKINDYSEAYKELFGVEKENNILYSMSIQKPKNTFVESNTVKIKNEKNEEVEFLSSSYNYNQNSKIDNVSKKIAVEGKDYNIYIPTAELVGKAVSSAFQQNSEFNENFIKRVEELRSQRGESLKSNSYQKARSEELDFNVLMEAINNPDKMKNNEKENIDMLDIENIVLEDREEIENNYVKDYNDLSDYEEYNEINLKTNHAFEDFSDLEYELGISESEELDNYEKMENLSNNNKLK